MSFFELMANLFSCARTTSSSPNLAHGRRTLKSMNCRELRVDPLMLPTNSLVCAVVYWTETPESCSECEAISKTRFCKIIAGLLPELTLRHV